MNKNEDYLEFIPKQLIPALGWRVVDICIGDDGSYNSWDVPVIGWSVVTPHRRKWHYRPGDEEVIEDDTVKLLVLDTEYGVIPYDDNILSGSNVIMKLLSPGEVLDEEKVKEEVKEKYNRLLANKEIK